MKDIFFRYYLVVMIAILTSSACYAQTNQGYSKKKTVTTKTVSRSKSSKKQKSGSHQSHSSSKQSGNQNYDIPIFEMNEISKKIENQDYIVFLDRNGSVYGFNKNTHKYFSIMTEVADIGFKDSSKSLLSILTNNNIRYFYNLLSGKTEKEELTQQIINGSTINSVMNKEAKVLAGIKGAVVDLLTDPNGYTAIQVTFSQQFLFNEGKNDLNYDGSNAIRQLAQVLLNIPNTNVLIFGHTDNSGTLFVNQKISKAWARAVFDELEKKGVKNSRMVCDGLDYQYPVASNETAAGRAQNRRVEIYITANEQMIRNANRGY